MTSAPHRSKVWKLGVALLLSSILATVALGTFAGAQSDGEFVHVEGVGLAREVSEGLLEVQSIDGTTFYTHKGTDVIPNEDLPFEHMPLPQVNEDEEPDP